MDTKEILGKGIEYDHLSIADKHYFGGFLNLAENNIKLVKELFKSRFNISLDSGFDFERKISYADWNNRILFLKQYFPVVHYLDLPVNHDRFKNYSNAEKENEKRKYFNRNFKLIIKTIDDLRNFYTHHFHKPLDTDQHLFSILDDVFLQTCIDVRRNRMKNDYTRQLLKKELDGELVQLIKIKTENLKRKKELGEKVSLNPESIRNAVFNESFNYLIYKTEEKDELVRDIHKSQYFGDTAENGMGLSRSGLIFLTSMFLSKKDGEDLRSRVKGYKAKVIKRNSDGISATNNSLRYMATHWVFSYLAFKGVKQRVNTVFDKETLIVQIIDELSKVPDEIYRTLSNGKKQEFLEDLNEYVKEGKQIESLNDSLVVHPVIRKRHESKFNYFVLRYLDEFIDFPSLRFQINAGSYVHDKREKTIDGTHYIVDRTVKERVKVFAKLSEVVKARNEFYLKKSVENIGWEDFPNPSYNFYGNNIPIYINLQDKDVPNAKETYSELNYKYKQNPEFKKKNNIISRSSGKADKNLMVDLLTKHDSKLQFKIEAPVALLSLNELPALLYKHLIEKKSGADIEKHVVRKIVEHVATIKNYDSTIVLSNSQIPKKLKKSDNSEHIDYVKLLNNLKKELEIGIDKEKVILRHKNELKAQLRKKLFKNSELGREATWLATDIIRFMPKESRQNWKGYHQSQLQNTLAFYDSKMNEAFSLLSQYWNMEQGVFWGEQIKEVFKKKSFNEFYSAYLDFRKNLFNNMINSVGKNVGNSKIIRNAIKDCWIIFPKRAFVLRSKDDQINSLLAKTLVLPRGVFDDKPTFIKGVKYDENPELFANWYRYTYQVNLKFQEFYDTERDYLELFEQEKKQNKEFLKNKKHLTEAEQFDLFRMKNDRKIKNIKTQDLFLKLILDQLFAKMFDYIPEFNLKDIYQNQRERRENRSKAMVQSERTIGNDSENVYNENFIWNKPIVFQKDQIVEPAIQIKNIGKFKKFLCDDKVKTILSYDPTRQWSKKELEEELEIMPTSYEVLRREKLLKDIQDFEAFILVQNNFDGKNHPSSFEDSKGNPNFKSYLYQGLLIRLSSVNQDDIKAIFEDEKFEDITVEQIENKSIIVQKAFLLVLIRNKISHNQLPSKSFFDLVKLLYPLKEYFTYSEYLSIAMSEIIKDLKIYFLEEVGLDLENKKSPFDN